MHLLNQFSLDDFTNCDHFNLDSFFTHRRGRVIHDSLSDFYTDYEDDDFYTCSPFDSLSQL